MARAGGTSGKLGDRYEAVWTVDSLLDVLVAEAHSLVVEPFDKTESLGIEFKKETGDWIEFHSAKRQTADQLWSIADLMRPGESGRSVLGDLFAKLELDPRHHVVFVSGTTAQDLERICEAASDSRDAAAFENQIDAVSRELRKKFEDRILRPQFGGNLPEAWERLRRIRVVGWNEREMIRRVDQRIRATLYRPDGSSLDATATRTILAEMIFGFFGQKITREHIVSYLAEHGFAERDWTRERGPRELVEKRNTAYAGNVEAELIASERLAREEASKAVDALIGGDQKCAVFIGAAGLGKSCTVAQTLMQLREAGIPSLALRLDIQTEVLTSSRLGEELGLPESPVLVLAGIANGGRSVLILDQLDAISFVSGRNQRLWQVFEEMLLEAQNYPQMRILLACREFDAEHDPRLRKLLADSKHAFRIEIGKLSVEAVREIIRKHAGVDPANLDATRIELLRTPLHLSLYLQGEPQSQPQFIGVQELLGRYWSHKRRLVSRQLGRESRWLEIIRCLVDRLSSDQTLSAPRTLLDRFDELEIDVLASLNVIVLDGDSVRFFHEAFFDYSFARFFAERKESLLQLLTADGQEQHLFRRAQVRQILEYGRERDFDFYLRNLEGLLTNSTIRYHLKKLTLEWLGNLANPKAEEWRLLEALNFGTPLGKSARWIPWNRPPWIALLFRLGVWERWLDSSDPQLVGLAVQMLSLPAAMQNCSSEIARLFRPYVVGPKIWKKEYQQLFSFGESYHSAEMFELLCETTKLGLLGEPNTREWHRYEKLPRANPEFAVKWLAVLLDLKNDPGDETDDELWIEIESNFITETARHAPEAFARVVLPRVIEKLKTVDQDGRGRMLERRTVLLTNDTSVALNHGLEIALGLLAREKPETLDSVVVIAEESSLQFCSATLLAAWSKNGERYGDRIVSYLLQDQKRLELKFFMWESASALAAVRSASPHCSQPLYEKLEAAILAHTPENEKNDLKLLGHYRMRLLECLPTGRISHKARMHFEELKRKFPWEKFERREYGIRGGVVLSPIPEKATPHMTDEQWMEAMRTYPEERKLGADFLKGGKYQLSNVLRREAQVYKSRFSQLALRMEDSIAPEYFSAILAGISTTRSENAGEPKLPESALEPLDPETIVRVIARVHAIGSPECSKDICRAVRSIAEAHPPSEIIKIVCDYAMKDPDPAKEEWQEMSDSLPTWGGDPNFHGINTVRGSAAEALAALLFADEEYFKEIEPAVLSVVRDRSIAVRSCALDCLLAMLNFDRDRAVELFLQLCDGAEEVLNSHDAEQFIHHATFRHYLPLRPLLLRMLKFDRERVRAIASRQIVLAAFHDSDAAGDANLVLSGDYICRKSAAEIYAYNVGQEAYRTVCAEHLARFFNDSHQDVRAVASDCFRQLPAERLTQEQDLIFQFIESQACLENSHELIQALEDSAEPLPEVICKIPERLIAEQRALRHGEHIENRRWTYHLPALIARLYEQTADVKIESRCLDIIDGMIELGFSEIETELAQVER